MIALLGAARRDPPPARLFTLAFACNDPDNGCFSGVFQMFEIRSDGGIEVGLYGPETPLEQGPKQARVGSLTLDHFGWAYHVGNWCWDECAVSEATARRVLAALIAAGFAPEEWSDGPFSDLVEAAP